MLHVSKNTVCVFKCIAILLYLFDLCPYVYSNIKGHTVFRFDLLGNDAFLLLIKPSTPQAYSRPQKH